VNLPLRWKVVFDVYHKLANFRATPPLDRLSEDEIILAQARSHPETHDHQAKTHD